jgi:alkylation response protein AidB-like acyl-CoA dehydrogenase
MNLRDSPAEAQLRAAARRWLADHLPAGWREGLAREPADLRERFAFRHAWHQELFRAGWVGLHWPERYGGRGLSLGEQVVFNEELARVEAPPIANWVGVELVGPTLMRWGSELQRSEHLGRILDGAHVWCQAFSEPEAGSDLAVVVTCATRDGESYVIRGCKRWTSWATFADFTLLLARTGSVEARHRGLSMFIVPMSAAGMTVRPLRMAYGSGEENELLLEDVVVPASSMVGRPGEGWSVLLHSLGLSRGLTTLTRVVALQGLFVKLVRLAHRRPQYGNPASDDPSVRRRLGELYARIQALRFLAYCGLDEAGGASSPTPMGSVEKLAWSALTQDLSELALQIQGPGARLLEDLGDGTWPGQWQYELFRAKASAIEGGTTEIQRNTIARRLLGLAPAY